MSVGASRVSGCNRRGNDEGRGSAAVSSVQVKGGSRLKRGGGER